MTKYELATQLRELNRGMPRLSISTMKKHEIEANIDAIRKYKGLVAEEMTDRAPTKRGPLGPRPIEVAEEVDEGEGLTMRMPKAPAERVSVKPPKVKVAVPKVSFDSTDAAPAPVPVKTKVPKVPKAPKTETALASVPVPDSRKSAPVMTHFCNCPQCPARKH